MAATIRIAILATALLTANAHAQSTGAALRGGLVGTANALGELANRQLDVQAELELTRKKAEIELEMNMRLLKAQQSTPNQAAVAQELEEAKLARAHPQWVRIITSNAFKSWMAVQLPQYASACMSTTAGDVMAACINDFFDKPTHQQR
jgi:hypothetical protein